jgi:predicted ArsR family transcriptional regulator
MTAKNTVESDALVHRALADRSRVGILEALRGADEPLDARQLAGSVGLHVNTVRSHLRQLEGAALVRARRDAQGKPGRPRIVFESTGRAETGFGQASAYRLLAEVLARSVTSEARTATREAEAAACSAARTLASADMPAEPASDEARTTPGLHRVMHLLSTLGFDPVAQREQDADEIVMRSCPFDGLGDAALELACSVHRGLIRGALDEHARTEASALVELRPKPGRCVARVAAAG